MEFLNVDISDWNNIAVLPNTTILNDKQLSCLAQQVAVLSWYKCQRPSNNYSFAGACAVYQDALFDYHHPQRKKFIEAVKRASENRALKEVAYKKKEEEEIMRRRHHREDQKWLMEYVKRQNTVENRIG